MTDASRSSTLLSMRAARLAERSHRGQVDKVGKAYIGHPARIAMAVRDEGYSDEVEAVAWLHDVVEDTAVTLDDLRADDFPERVVEAVDAISKRKGESFADYYERVKANPIALVVKWHDVADNADPKRLALVAPDTQERLRAKYERARSILGGPDSKGSSPQP
jgi:(p)ppGpp synthase/HD superfamily hydrolase